jgi:hypothetical protein
LEARHARPTLIFIYVRLPPVCDMITIQRTGEKTFNSEQCSVLFLIFVQAFWNVHLIFPCTSFFPLT